MRGAVRSARFFSDDGPQRDRSFVPSRAPSARSCKISREQPCKMTIGGWNFTAGQKLRVQQPLGFCRAKEGNHQVHFAAFAVNSPRAIFPLRDVTVRRLFWGVRRHQLGWNSRWNFTSHSGSVINVILRGKIPKEDKTWSAIKEIDKRRERKQIYTTLSATVCIFFAFINIRFLRHLIERLSIYLKLIRYVHLLFTYITHPSWWTHFNINVNSRLYPKEKKLVFSCKNYT